MTLQRLSGTRFKGPLPRRIDRAARGRSHPRTVRRRAEFPGRQLPPPVTPPVGLALRGRANICLGGSVRGDTEFCECGPAGHCATQHVGHKMFRDANNESTNIVIKEKGGTEASHERRSKVAIVADKTLAPHRRAPEAMSRTEQPTSGGKFRGVVYAMVEQLQKERPWKEQIPSGRRCWVSAAAATALVSKALELRKVRRKKRTEHKKTATDQQLKRSLAQIRAGDTARNVVEAIVGSANYFKQGGLPANPQMAFQDDLLRHRLEQDGTVNPRKVAKSWKVDAQRTVDEQIMNPGRQIGAVVSEVIGSLPKVRHIVKAFGNDESDRIGSTKRAKTEAREQRTNAWWEEENPGGVVVDSR